MIDEVSFRVQAGNGGKGAVHFRREKYAPRGGPDGGDGGDGGSVYFVSDLNLTTLRFFSGKDRFTAEHGRRGGMARKHGENGEDIELRVPVGTVVEVVSGKDESKGVLYADLDTRDMRVCVARGGHGGRGNWYFRSPTNTTPRTAEPGIPGEARWLRLSLKVLAQVGLVGLPNAGKSTLLSILTAAKPAIAAYPFTTVSPNLGVLTEYSASLVIADIPGLIEGASRGKGLGIAFLKHIERCELLVYVLFPEDWVLAGISGERKIGETIWKQREQLRAELAAFSPRLLQLPALMVLNKIDLLSQEEIASIRRFFRTKRITIIPISAATLANIDGLRRAIVRQYTKIHNSK